MVTRNLMSLEPITTSFYPAGYFVRQIPVRMTVKYPDGWAAASALNAKVAGSTYTYEPTNYEILLDSPILAGRYYKKWALSDRVNLNVFADTQAELDAATPEMIDAHKRLVDQAVKTFGAQHYDHYEFLFSISNELGGIGLEHHRSSEDGTRMGYFSEWANNAGARNLLPHEYTHSWDGKFRRGADLWTPDYRYPMRDSLLWVYEGQTQFWGYVLQARADLVSKQDTLDAYAAIMANLDYTHGPPVAPDGRHHQRPDHLQPPAQGLDQLSARRGLLQRRPAGLDGGRFDPARAVEGDEVDRRFRPRVLRHQRRRLGRGDLYVRRRRRDARQDPAVRLARAADQAADRGRPARPARRVRTQRLQAGLYRRADPDRQAGANARARSPTSAIRSASRSAATPASARCAGAARRSTPG